MSDTEGTGPKPIIDPRDPQVTPPEHWTAEQWSEFERMFAEAHQQAEARPQSQAERVQADPPDEKVIGLTMEQILAALETAVMVVRPGEVLVVRVPPWLNPQQVANYQEAIDELLRWHGLNDLHVLVLQGEQFVRMRPGEDTVTRVEAPTGPVNDLRPTMAVPSEPPATGPQPVQGIRPYDLPTDIPPVL